MARRGFKEINRHKVLHNEFVAKVDGILLDIHRGRVVLNSEIVKMIENWLKCHIINEDKKIVLRLEKAKRPEKEANINETELFKMLLKSLTEFVLIAAVLIVSSFSHAGEKLVFPIDGFSTGEIVKWQKKKFVGETDYSLEMEKGQMVLRAFSSGSASALVKKVRVDLEKYPFINFSWKIGKRLSGLYSEKEKSGDDYAARVYIIKSGGIALWKTKALNYVWAKHAPKESVWANAFARNNAVMVALRSSGAQVGEWVTEKRNAKKDFEKLFKEKIRFIDAVALMSDTDNTGNHTTAFYKDIYFSSK